MRWIYLHFCIFVLFCCPPAFGAFAAGATPQEVQFLTSDGVRISGVFCPPATSKKKTFILLHGLGSGKGEWQKFAALLQKAGYGYLLYDARGHGQSTETADKKHISYESFGRPRPGSGWSKMVQDLGAAVAFLGKTKKILPASIGLGGASLGANVCLVYAAEVKEINPVLLLSPGMEYAGLRADTVITSYQRRPLILAASARDPYAYESSQFLYRTLQGNQQAVFLTAPSGHGVEMFDGNFEQKLLREIRKY